MAVRAQPGHGIWHLLKLVTWMAPSARPELRWHAKCDSWQGPASHYSSWQWPWGLSRGEAAAAASHIQDILGEQLASAITTTLVSAQRGLCVCVLVTPFTPRRCVRRASFSLYRNPKHLPPIPPTLLAALALGQEAQVFEMADNEEPKPERGCAGNECLGCSTVPFLCQLRQTTSPQSLSTTQSSFLSVERLCSPGRSVSVKGCLC